MKPQEDNYYIERTLAGETNAFSELVNRHSGLVFSIIIKIVGTRELAEEVAQDVFVKAYKMLHTFKQEARFSTWLYRIAYNAAISESRKKRIQFIPIVDNCLSVPDTKVDDDKLRRIQLLNKALEELSADEIVIVSLFYKNNKSIEEIAYITGLTESNVKTKLHRIRKKLHEEIKTKENEANR